MFYKVAENAIHFNKMQVTALNIPEGPDWDIFKTSSELSIDKLKVSKFDKDKDLNGYDLTAAVKEHPNNLFVKCFAIKEDEVNENGDSFSAEELKKSADTFIGVPLFCNHANDDIEKARGKCVHAWYDEKDGGIYIIAMVDKVAYPKLARGIEEGYITGTSMGCQVHHSYCSICHNMAHTADQYCTHVKNSKTRKFSGKVKCAYHDSKVKDGESSIDEKCPICGCKEGEKKELVHKDALTHEHNVGLRFIENSFVVNPACKSCGVNCILNVPEFEKKVASMRTKLTKMANWIGGERLIKVAGKQEVDYLNRAMKMMEVVAKSMMDQKEQVSMEYVSDIVDVLADLQTATDELVEMGYSQIPSPPTLQNPDTLKDAVLSPSGQSGQVGQAQASVPQQPAAPPQPTGSTTTPSGGIGSVTKPSFAPKASGNLKEMLKEGSNLDKKLSEIADKREIHDSNKESQEKMENNLKTAAGDALKEEHLHITTEKRLQDAKLDYHPRTNSAPTGTTESKEQLGLSTEPVNDTTSKSPQVRDGEYANVTTENQLPKIDGPIARWEEYPDVTTEKQWTEFTREVGSILSKDQSEHTTGAQLNDLRSHHRWIDPNYTTENQLKSDDNWLTKDNAWLDKAASAAYSKRLVTAAMESLADAIAVYHKTPSEIVKAVNFITRDQNNIKKASLLTLVNGIPKNIKARKAEKERAVYFGKTASSVGAVDAVLACMGDNCLNLKAEDFVDAVRYVATDENRLASVETLAEHKAVNGNPEVDPVVDKVAAFDAAFDSIVASDGLHQVRTSFEDIGVDDENDPSFLKSAEAYARAKVAKANTVLYNIELGEDTSGNATGEVFVTLKESSHLTAVDVAALEAKKNQNSIRIAGREVLVKEAQMGGQLGGGMDGSGGGAGATMPTPQAPPGAPTDPAAPPAESLEGSPDGETGDDAGDENEAMPPGSICPVCGSKDVDIVEGKGKCNNCNSQFVFKVQVEVTRWTGVNDTNSQDGEGEEGGDGMGGDEGGEGEGAGEGFAMPEGGADMSGGGAGAGAAPNIPVAAMTKISPEIITKLAAANIELGVVSPLTGTSNTHKLANGKRLCMDTGITYEVVTLADVKNPKVVWAEWRWTPKFATITQTANGFKFESANSECPTCRRAKSVWAKALKSTGLTDDQFETLSFIKKADTIIEMDKKGLFKEIKTASKTASVIGEFKKAYSIAGEFPTKSCREKLARRYGENALAISGPCKGQKLWNCVCGQLKKASVYSDDLAIKVADSWKDRDGCIECTENYVRFGYDIEKAAAVCQHLKMKYASPADMFADEMSDSAPPAPGHSEHPEHGTDDSGDMSDAPDFDNPDGGSPEDGMNGSPDGDVQIDVEPSPDGGEDINVEPGADGMGGDDLSSPLDLPGSGSGDDMGANNSGGAGNHGDVTIQIPLHALDAIEKAIDKAHGGGGNLPEIPSDAGNPNVDVSIPEGAVDDLQQNGTDAINDEIGDGSGGDEFGGDTGNSDGGDEFGDNGGDSEPDPDAPADGDFGGGSDGSEDSSGDNSSGEGDVPDENSEFKETEADHLANVFRRGKRVGQIDLDMTKILAAINKEAEEGSDVKWELAQDAAGKISGDSAIGGEEEFSADKPNVPVGGTKAEMGRHESHPPKPGVKVPQNGPKNKNETEQGYTSDGANATGGDKGQGQTPLASNKKNVRTADEKKVNPPKPTSEVTKVPYSNNKDLKTTPDGLKRVPFEKSEENLNVPEKGEGAYIGDEQSSIGNIPKATPEFAPEIPTGGGMNPKYDRNEKNKPEMTNDVRGIKANSKGTIVSKTDEKSKKAVEAEAIRIATRMLRAQLIDDTDLMKKIGELSQYKLSQLADIEKALFRTAKGLAMASDGIESPVPVADSHAGQRNSQDDLTNDLKGLFTLTRRNNEASELTDANLRARYNRR